MSLEYIRKTYQVPAIRGMRVEYTGDSSPQLGTIIGAASGSGYLKIKLDGAKTARRFHPTWKLKYLEQGGVQK